MTNPDQIKHDLDYIASPTAAGLASGRSRLVGIITPFMARWFFTGIMSAIDFKMDLQREPNAAGDRVSITMSGKFLPYKTY